MILKQGFYNSQAGHRSNSCILFYYFINLLSFTFQGPICGLLYRINSSDPHIYRHFTGNYRSDIRNVIRDYKTCFLASFRPFCWVVCIQLTLRAPQIAVIFRHLAGLLLDVIRAPTGVVIAGPISKAIFMIGPH